MKGRMETGSFEESVFLWRRLALMVRPGLDDGRAAWLRLGKHQKIKNRPPTDHSVRRRRIKFSPRYHFFYRIFRSLSPVVRPCFLNFRDLLLLIRRSLPGSFTACRINRLPGNGGMPAGTTEISLRLLAGDSRPGHAVSSHQPETLWKHICQGSPVLFFAWLWIKFVFDYSAEILNVNNFFA